MAAVTNNDANNVSNATQPGSLTAARVVSDICEALVHSAPEYSEVHDGLASICVADSGDEDHEQLLLDYMVNNRRCHVAVDAPDGCVHLESLNLGGFSLERVEKKLGEALGRAVFAHGLDKLYLSGNSLKDIQSGLGWLIVENDEQDIGHEGGRSLAHQGERQPALSEIFINSNIIRNVDWPPSSLAGVSKCLAHIDMSNNKIRTIDVVAAPLPRPITLHRLEWLDLSGNIKLEVLPDGFFASMPNLKRLDAYSCALTAVSEDISVCKELVHCGLHSNELEVLPDGLFQCEKLVWLSLNMNKLERLPESIGNLKSLERLSLHQNRLRTLPASISECAMLEALSVHHNNLESLPNSMASLTRCSRLSLYENRKLACIPDAVYGMTGLKELWLYDCGLTSLNKKIGDLRALQKLWLDRNPGLVIDEESRKALESLDLMQELYLDSRGT